MGHEPEHALPAEQHGGGEHHAHAVGGGKDGGGDEIERGVGVKEGVVALQRADDGAEHRQRADAVEQYGGGKTVGEGGVLGVGCWVLGVVPVHESMETAVDVEGSANDAADGNGYDEEYGVLAFGEVGDGGVEANGEAGKPEGVVEGGFVFLLDASVEQASYNGSHNDGGGVDNGSNHSFVLIDGKISTFLTIKCRM